MNEYEMHYAIEDRKPFFLVQVKRIVLYLAISTTAALEDSCFCDEVDDIAEIIKGVEILRSDAEKLLDALEELSSKKEDK